LLLAGRVKIVRDQVQTSPGAKSIIVTVLPEVSDGAIEPNTQLIANVCKAVKLAFCSLVDLVTDRNEVVAVDRRRARDANYPFEKKAILSIAFGPKNRTLRKVGNTGKQYPIAISSVLLRCLRHKHEL